MPVQIFFVFVFVFRKPHHNLTVFFQWLTTNKKIYILKVKLIDLVLLYISISFWDYDRLHTHRFGFRLKRMSGSIHEVSKEGIPGVKIQEMWGRVSDGATLSRALT